MADYIVRGPAAAVHNGDMFSQKTANVDLSSTDWAPSADSADATQTRCPRAFIANAAGTLSYKAIDDASAVTVVVAAGGVYPIALVFIDQSACSAPLQIAAALTLLY